MAAQFEGLTQETADFAAMKLIGTLASAAIGTRTYELLGGGESTSGIPAVIPDDERVRLPREAFATPPETIHDYNRERIEERLRAPLKGFFIDLHQPPYERRPFMDYEAEPNTPYAGYRGLKGWTGRLDISLPGKKPAIEQEENPYPEQQGEENG